MVYGHVVRTDATAATAAVEVMIGYLSFLGGGNDA